MPGRVTSLFRNVLCKRTVEQALDEELQSSVELLAEEKMKEGFSPSEARRQALIELGGIEQVKEEVRVIRAGHLLEDFAKDVRFAFRTLAKSPGFTAVAVILLSQAGAVVFIYPVWWSDCPAKLKGWFDRVWAYGYAYFYEKDGARRSFVQPRRALVICSAGHTREHLEQTGMAGAMRCIMLEDRLKNVGFTDVRMEILGGMMPGDATYREENLERAYRLGRDF